MPVYTYLDLSTAHLTPATRTWLDTLDWELEGPSGGIWEKLPEGSFKESGTAVDTYVLTIDMPRAA